jgi:predicted dehydrogenase
MEKLRWGILSTADIARQNWRAIYDSGNSIVAAVASRSKDRSERFIAACQADVPFERKPAPFGSYRELLDSGDVDAVYIPLPTGIRKEWVLRAAEAGKHVLSEKPCGVSLHDVQEMADACKRNRVQFMDGVMFVHHPRLQRIREVLDDGRSVGEIKRISSFFSFFAPPEDQRTNIRFHSELEPAGCLGDLGWYNIRFTLWALNWQMPRAVAGRILSQRQSSSSPAPTPSDFSGELFFDNDVSAGFYNSFLTAYQEWVAVSGTNGVLKLTDFVHPASIHEPSFEVNGSEVKVRCCDCTGPHTESKAQAQDARMFRNFADRVFSGTLNDEWPMMALKTQQVVDACLESARQGGKVIEN